jgi:hypothetical protein
MAEPSLEQRRRQLVNDEISRSSDVAITMFRWFLSSLLILHGGALVALVGVDDLRPAFVKGPAWFFAGGLATALFAGFATARAYAHYVLSMADWLWAGKQLEAGSFSELSKAAVPRKRLVVSRLLMVASLILFVTGCFAVAWITPTK